jgi:agmatine/peptidylarginine deiminase
MRGLRLGLLAGFLATVALPAVAQAQIVHPAEYEQSNEILWGCNNTALVADVYRECVRGTVNEAVNHVFLMDSKESAYQVLYDLYDKNISTAKAKFYVCALNSVWMRDYGPFIVRENGQPTVVDVNYYPNRPTDDSFPKIWARFKQWGYRYGNLDYEGGNFMSDGKGTGFASNSVYKFNSYKLSKSGVDGVFKNTLGCNKVETFEYLLNDGTTHIDMYAKLLNNNTVLVSRAVGNWSQNYALLERNAQKFASLGYNVLRATMADDDLSTYTNSLIVGRTALVPTYNNPTRDAEALNAYRQAGYTAFGVDCRKVIKYGGAIHCISMQSAR